MLVLEYVAFESELIADLQFCNHCKRCQPEMHSCCELCKQCLSQMVNKTHCIADECMWDPHHRSVYRCFDHETHYHSECPAQTDKYCEKCNKCHSDFVYQEVSFAIFCNVCSFCFDSRVVPMHCHAPHCAHDPHHILRHFLESKKYWAITRPDIKTLYWCEVCNLHWYENSKHTKGACNYFQNKKQLV